MSYETVLIVSKFGSLKLLSSFFLTYSPWTPFSLIVSDMCKKWYVILLHWGIMRIIMQHKMRIFVNNEMVNSYMKIIPLTLHAGFDFSHILRIWSQRRLWHHCVYTSWALDLLSSLIGHPVVPVLSPAIWFTLLHSFRFSVWPECTFLELSVIVFKCSNDI